MPLLRSPSPSTLRQRLPRSRLYWCLACPACLRLPPKPKLKLRPRLQGLPLSQTILSQRRKRGERETTAREVESRSRQSCLEIRLVSRQNAFRASHTHPPYRSPPRADDLPIALAAAPIAVFAAARLVATARAALAAAPIAEAAERPGLEAGARGGDEGRSVSAPGCRGRLDGREEPGTPSRSLPAAAGLPTPAAAEVADAAAAGSASLGSSISQRPRCRFQLCPCFGRPRGWGTSVTTHRQSMPRSAQSLHPNDAPRPEPPAPGAACAGALLPTVCAPPCAPPPLSLSGPPPLACCTWSRCGSSFSQRPSCRFQVCPCFGRPRGCGTPSAVFCLGGLRAGAVLGAPVASGSQRPSEKFQLCPDRGRPRG